jgi:glycosyltransferase involved in cell wall biosynthesis
VSAEQITTTHPLPGELPESGGRRLRIAYLARWDIGAEDGVLKKIREQLRAWQAQGHEVRLFALSPALNPWPGLNGLPLEVVCSASNLGRERAMQELLQRALRWHPDVAYLRFNTHYVALEPFMARVRTVLELNTDDVAEYKLYLPRHKYWYHRLTRGRILSRAAGFVSVTHEIAATLTRFGKPTCVIGNSIDLSSYRALPVAESSQPRAVFMGLHEAPWHGIDKILDLAAALPQWHFELIGPSLSPAALPANVTAHGHLGRAEYQSVVARADVAIGTLALHRKGMDEACPLKVREYLAFGLPCILGYLDTDLPGPLPFVLQLPNKPDNVAGAVPAIRAFGERWQGRRVERDAILHLDVQQKEALRTRFLAGVAVSR